MSIQYFPKRLHELKKIPKITVTSSPPTSPPSGAFELAIRTDTHELEFAASHAGFCKVKEVEIAASHPLPRLESGASYSEV